MSIKVNTTVMRFVHDNLPPIGTKAADLTEDQKLALAFAAGARMVTEHEGGRFLLRTHDLLGFYDHPDGRIGVVVKAAQQSDQPAPGITDR